MSRRCFPGQSHHFQPDGPRLCAARCFRPRHSPLRLRSLNISSRPPIRRRSLPAAIPATAGVKGPGSPGLGHASGTSQPGAATVFCTASCQFMTPCWRQLDAGPACTPGRLAGLGRSRAKPEPPDPLDGPLLVVPSCCATGSSQATAAALAVTACALMIPAAGTLRTPCRRRRSSMKPLSASTSAAAGQGARRRVNLKTDCLAPGVVSAPPHHPPTPPRPPANGFRCRLAGSA